MESEKVKEIKIVLKGLVDDASNWLQNAMIGGVNLADILTLINELESENERLNKSDTSKEEISIKYYNLYKDLKRKNKDLNELCELQRVSIAESFVRENKLKDRIAELEKENENKTNTITDLLNKQEFYEKEKVTKFAEMLKDKRFYSFNTESDVVEVNDIDETLKEFICSNINN